MSTTKQGQIDSASPQRERSGFQAISETLRDGGVEIVFGYSGGGVMHALNGVIEAGITPFAGRTELASAWMSYGYNRVKRRAASACLFHCVGTLHASPVVYAAKSDATPFVMIDINLGHSLDLREPLQDSEPLGAALRPLSKYFRRLTTAEDAPLAVRQAITSASTGRFGPAVLDLAFEVVGEPTVCPTEPLTLPDRPAASEQSIDRIMAKLSAAERPVLFVGAGVHLADAAQELQAFAEMTGIPVVSSAWGGRGVLPDDHPLYAGPLGSFGWTCANDLAQRADLWVAIGTSFSQMTTAAWSIAKPDDVVQIDVDPYEIGKIFQPTVGVAADARVVLQQLCARVSSESPSPAGEPWADVEGPKQDWLDQVEGLSDGTEVPINQHYLLRVLSEELPSNSLGVADSGGHAFMFYRGFQYKQSQPLATGSRYMSLGASLPVAIGAKLADPELTVVSYHGDGGFYYDFAELSTLAEHNIKVIIVLDNNGCLLANRSGMKMWGYDNPWCDLPETDFVKLAESMGVQGEKVTDPADLRDAVKRALASEGSYILDVATDPEFRLKRAISDVIPILTDRNPHQQKLMDDADENHVSFALEGAWPR